MRATPTLLIMLAIAMLESSVALCQKSAKGPKERIYNALVSVSNQKKKIVGVLKEVDDSTIHLVFRNGSLRINARVINSITIKRKGNVGRGILLGSLSAMFVGGLIGYASGDDMCDPGIWCWTYTAEDKAAIGSFLGAGIGALVGWGIGSGAKAKIEIGRNPKIFKRNVERLQMYALPSGYIGY